MAVGRITITSVNAAEARARDSFLWDDVLHGFGLKVTPAGARSYIYQYRLGGREAAKKRWTIGRHASPWTPKTARAEAERLSHLVGQGIDPVEAERQRRKIASTLGFRAYVDVFSEGYLETAWGDSWKLAKRRLEMYAVPELGDRPLPEIQPSEITPIFDKVRGKPALAANLYAVMRKLFIWAERRDDIERSPMLKMDAPRAVKARKRVLSPDELVALWRATFKLEDPFGPFVRLLICTLQRRSEVAGMSWLELHHNGQTWRLPGERAKNEADHLVPLNALAVAEFDAMKWKRKGLIFSTTGNTAISGFSKMKKKLDAAMVAEFTKLVKARAAAAGEAPDEVVIPRWVIHDIRRTGTTQMQALGVPIEVTERVINHLSGETSGIRGVYNLHDYAVEKRRAMDAWGAHVAALLSRATTESTLKLLDVS
jgi:integrase